GGAVAGGAAQTDCGAIQVFTAVCCAHSGQQAARASHPVDDRLRKTASVTAQPDSGDNTAMTASPGIDVRWSRCPALAHAD
ncbi:MAG: hypothetical protein KDA85_15965, partial [Planctomycetaceae bacterium]|nr:hypothetical protein [Planctomycetaceae bacterium]